MLRRPTDCNSKPTPEPSLTLTAAAENVNAYAFLFVTDRYPPFSLKAG